jgi:hypothetical protein
LRNIGATAQAQGIAPDALSDNDRGNAQSQVACGPACVARTASQSDPGDQKTYDDIASATEPTQPATSQAAGALTWPWAPAGCLDAQTTPVNASASAPLGEASVHCDLAQSQVSASAGAEALRSDALTIASSTFAANATRVQGVGVSTQATAAIRGLDLTLAGAGRLQIGAIEQHVTTTAGGRPGTNSVTWSRILQGVRVLDATGKVLFECTVCPDPHQVASAVNDALGLQLHMTVPDPEITTTPKGAFAGFEEKFPQYVNDLVMNNDPSAGVPAIQLEIYNDWSNKSRLFLQLAQIQSSAIYGISSTAFSDGGSDGGGGGSGPPPPTEVLPLKVQRIETPVPPITNSTGMVQRVVRSALFLIRSPKDALAIALILILLSTFVGLGARRRTLMENLAAGTES